jgi:hypothetical protein
MKTLPKRFALLLGLMTSVSAYFVLPASADSSAGLLLNLKCQGRVDTTLIFGEGMIRVNFFTVLQVLKVI